MTQAAHYVVRSERERLAPDAALALIADRFVVTDPTTGEAVWRPRGGSVGDLCEALGVWLSPSREVSIDPDDPLSRLLQECTCRPEATGKCPVHRSAARDPRRRAAAVAALVQREGSMAAAARVLGVSYQRVQQILQRAAGAKETR